MPHVARDTLLAIKPTPAELELLRVLWQIGPASVKDVLTARLPEIPELNYAAVLRQMQVMHSKGLLTRDESAHSHVYAAAHAQAELQQSLLGEIIQKLFGGSGKKLVLAALSSHTSKAERDEIKRFLKEPGDA
jgi:predicted transcriptional regulator